MTSPGGVQPLKPAISNTRRFTMLKTLLRAYKQWRVDLIDAEIDETLKAQVEASEYGTVDQVLELEHYIIRLTAKRTEWVRALRSLQPTT